MALTYTAVVGRGRTASDIDNYLYGHTSRAVTIQTDKGVFAVLATGSEASPDPVAARTDADYYARYQADRLRSGLFAVFGPEADLVHLLADSDVQYVAGQAGAQVSALVEALQIGVGK